MPGPLLGRDSLWFDSCKGDHLVFAFWVVAYKRFYCIWFVFHVLLWELRGNGVLKNTHFSP